MKHLIFTSLIWLALLSGVQQLKSPNEAFTMDFRYKMTEHLYALKYKNKVKTSKLGFRVKNDDKSLLNDFHGAGKTTTLTKTGNQFGVK
jgi:hypothetical protein